MRRDIDLCRHILIEIESWDTTQIPKQIRLDGYSKDQTGYHAWLLAEEGMVVGVDVTSLGDSVRQFAPRSLTYRGHDFLELGRNETRWQKAKARVLKVGGPITSDIMMSLLRNLAARAVGLPDA